MYSHKCVLVSGSYQSALYNVFILRFRAITSVNRYSLRNHCLLNYKVGRSDSTVIVNHADVTLTLPIINDFDLSVILSIVLQLVMSMIL